MLGNLVLNLNYFSIAVKFGMHLPRPPGGAFYPDVSAILETLNSAPPPPPQPQVFRVAVGVGNFS